MNHIANKEIKNKYFILRHGESESFKSHLISSKPENCIYKVGLTKKGKNDVKDSVKKFITNNKGSFLNSNTIICSSDFKRASETTQIVAKILKTKDVFFVNELRERCFGNFENTNDSNYKLIWKLDKVSDEKKLKKMNIETPKQVQDRTSKLISNLEKKYSEKNILLVSHCDTLQILTTAFLRKDPNSHRSLKKIELAEIRKIKVK